jgi:hypothetical protein
MKYLEADLFMPYMKARILPLRYIEKIRIFDITMYYQFI